MDILETKYQKEGDNRIKVTKLSVTEDVATYDIDNIRLERQRISDQIQSLEQQLNEYDNIIENYDNNS